MGSINEARNSSTTLSLPFIDFSRPDDLELKPGTPYWDSLKSQVREALQEYGCFEASLDKFSSDLQSDVFRSLEELFDLPLPTKQRVVNPEVFYLGYMGQHPHLPGYESFGVDDPNLLVEVESFTDILWPHGGNPSFSNNIHSLSEVFCGLDQIVRRMIVESFGLEKYMDEHMSSTTNHFRVMKYEAASDETFDQKKVALKVHTDKNFITTLCGNDVDGLEIQTKKGEWVRFRPASPSGSLVVMGGDALYAWMNGRVHCPKHRVLLSRNDRSRYSFGLFTAPKSENIVKAPEELIDEQNPLLFKPFVYKQYLDAYSQAGLKDHASLITLYGL